jgi:hypothetical protein
MPLVLIAVVLTACPPGGGDSGPTSEPGSTSSASGSSTSGGTPATTGSTDPTSTGSSTTESSATTSVDPGTTQPVDTTGNATTGSDTTALDTTGGATTGGDTTGTTADENTSTGGPDDTDGIPDTTGGEVCEGGPEMADIEWSLEIPPALVGKPLTGDCEAGDVQVMGAETAVSFDCTFENAQHTLVLRYSLSPAHKFNWELVHQVKMNFRRESGPWTNEWLAITDGEINFWGVHADALAPPDIPVKEFYGIEIPILTPCDPQPDPCGQRQGLELRFPHVAEGMQISIPAHSGDFLYYGFPVPNAIWVEQATRLLEPIGCDNVAPVWLDFVFFQDFTNF